MLITSFEMDAKRSGIQEGIELGIQQGMQQGRQEGMQKGRLEGMQQGITQGENKRNADIVLKMASRGLDVKTISEYTDLDISEIERIKSKVQ